MKEVADRITEDNSLWFPQDCKGFLNSIQLIGEEGIETFMLKIVPNLSIIKIKSPAFGGAIFQEKAVLR